MTTQRQDNQDVPSTTPYCGNCGNDAPREEIERNGGLCDECKASENHWQEADATAVQDALRELADGMDGVRRVSTFEEEGVLTNDAGLVIKMADGSEFQLTIVKSR